MLSLRLQVIFFCGKHSECHDEMYCNDEYICHDCDDSFPNMCDSYDNDCCSVSFLKQCKKNPYGCEKKEIIEPKSIFAPVFLSSFLFTTIGYLFIGCYYNKYIKQKSGCDIIPNRDTWTHIGGLVKDGFHYSLRFMKN